MEYNKKRASQKGVRRPLCYTESEATDTNSFCIESEATDTK